MKTVEINVNNFNYSNVKSWISSYTHKEKVEFAIHCAELVIDLYVGASDSPKKAIQAAKVWVLNPSEENKNACKDATAAAYATASTTAADVAAYAAAYAAYAAAAAAAANAANAVTNAAAAAYAADAAGAAADAKKCVKETIVKYILDRKEMI